MCWIRGGDRFIENIFHHTLAESTTFAPGSETQMWYFRSGYDEKSYTQRGDKEGHPRAHACHPRLRLGLFTRALDWPTPYLSCYVIYYLPKAKNSEYIIPTVKFAEQIKLQNIILHKYKKIES